MWSGVAFSWSGVEQSRLYGGCGNGLTRRAGGDEWVCSHGNEVAAAHRGVVTAVSLDGLSSSYPWESARRRQKSVLAGSEVG